MWTLTQRADMPDVAAANAQILEDLENGASGLSLVLPGSVTAGAHGVAVTDARSLERLFDGVELDFISLRLDAGKHGRDLAMLVLDEYKRRLLDLSRCRLDLGLDPLGALALNGSIVNRAELSRRAGEMFTTAKSMDQTGGIFCADTRAYHGAGCSEAQELAIAIATAVDYMGLGEPDSDMEMVYHAYRIAGGPALVFKAQTPRENAELPSLVEVWPGAGSGTRISATRHPARARARATSRPAASRVRVSINTATCRPSQASRDQAARRSAASSAYITVFGSTR
mgnify:CR=1 FL=1